ncbi:MAG: (Fe-S)-binding protein [Fimbriimonadales bacterium]
MRVLFPRVHEATRRLLRRVGYTVREGDLGCCGALHAHNGYLDEGRAMRARVPDDLPIVVDSAGCGSWLKDGKRPAVDVSEFLFAVGLVQRLAESHGLEITVAYHDACHLAHGQGVRQPPRDLLAAIPQVRLEPLAESDTCCGSAGIYNIAQPKMARRLLERKWRHIEESGADVVALGNPGCHAWIAQAARERNRR